MAANAMENLAGVEALQLETNGRRTHYLKAGSGRPVVLLHGGASDSRDWLGTMAALAPHFTFYAPDLPGFGRNERKSAGYYLSEFFEAIEQFITALNLDEPDIVGHSFGGRVCLGIAVRGRVKIGKLVLIDSSGLGNVTRFGTALMTFFWALRQALRRPQPYPRFLVKEGEDYKWEGENGLRGLKIPTLLVWKQHDPYLPASSGRHAVKLIPGARLEIIPGFGHAPNKADTEIFNRLLLDFLKQADA